MANDEFHETPLMYGKTDGANLPGMPNDKYFAVGYNQRYGLVDVCEGNGDLFFEGRVNIESLLSELQPGNQEHIDSQVLDHIMESYHNLWDYRNNPDEHVSSPTPILEILSYKG